MKGLPSTVACPRKGPGKCGYRWLEHSWKNYTHLVDINDTNAEQLIVTIFFKKKKEKKSLRLLQQL